MNDLSQGMNPTISPTGTVNSNGLPLIQPSQGFFNFFLNTTRMRLALKTSKGVNANLRRFTPWLANLPPQHGLSWETVLNKRQAFREAFHGYQIQAVADMTDTELEALLENPAIIRNRAKIFATRANAQAFLRLQEEYGSFDAYLWSFVEGKTIVNDVPDYRQAPAKTPLSEKLAKNLKKRGFKFTGPVAVLSFLQAAGLIDDHENDCEWKSGH